jgi:hypothetical protein
MAVTLPPVPGVVKTVVQGAINNIPVNNIFYWLMDTTAGITDAQALQVATGVHNAYKTNMLPRFTNFYTQIQTTAQDLTTVSGGQGIFALSTAGSNGTQEIASSTCHLVSHKIARRYRGGHPRTYFPPAAGLALNDPQHWTAADVNGFQLAYNAFVAAAISSTVTGNTIDQHVSVSYHSGRVVRPVPVIDIIKSSVCETMVATQRRRIGR